jgi:hypothetical protein
METAAPIFLLETFVSHPQNWSESSNEFQSCISRCAHSVFRPWDDPAGKSSACELCNSGCKPKPMLGEKQLSKQKARIEKIVPPVVDEFIETVGEEGQELNEESDFQTEENSEAYREEAEEVEVGD